MLTCAWIKVDGENDSHTMLHMACREERLKGDAWVSMDKLIKSQTVKDDVL